MSSRVVIAGCGVFGVTAALELRRRGHEVRVLEASISPAPEAASTDISKVVRLEYGFDETYTSLAERSLELWHEWNRRWQRDGLPRLFHDTGLLLLCRNEMSPGDFEHDSYEMLRGRGHALERIGGRALAARFPAWSPSLSDGFLSPEGGYIESAGVVWALAQEARALGVEIHQQTPVRRLVTTAGRLVGLEDASGALHEADLVLLAVGSWSADLAPDLADSLQRNYLPVWHLRPHAPELFRADVFPVFTADIQRTGYYGFPLHPVHAVVKMARHGHPIDIEKGGEIGEGAELRPPDSETARLRDFLSEALPALADAEVIHSRLCPYCDTRDEHFWIAADPRLPGLTVAAGGSGHAFKFAPLLGAIIADTMEGREHPLSNLWGWRPELDDDAHGFEPSRCRSSS